jgi:predicted DNA-binding transcriptional regulator AlpA
MRIYMGDDLSWWVIEEADGGRWVVSTQRAGRAPFTGTLDGLRLVEGLPAMLVRLLGEQLIGARAVAELAGTDVTAVYGWHRGDGSFPQPASPRPLRWWKDEVRRWLADHPRAPGRHRRRHHAAATSPAPTAPAAAGRHDAPA